MNEQGTQVIPIDDSGRVVIRCRVQRRRGSAERSRITMLYESKTPDGRWTAEPRYWVRFDATGPDRPVQVSGCEEGAQLALTVLPRLPYSTTSMVEVLQLALDRPTTLRGGPHPWSGHA